MSFPWLQCTPPRKDGSSRRSEVACAELAHRAGLLYRLGFSQAAATQRLTAAWGVLVVLIAALMVLIWFFLKRKDARP